MPVLDLYCSVCGAERPNTYMPLYRLATPRTVDGYTVKTDFSRPTCCGVPMSNYVPHVTMDIGNGPGFTAFDAPLRQPDGSYQTVRVDSLSKMRAIERETEQRARNGEGEAMRFRMWSNTASNGDVNTFGDDPSVQARKDLETLRQQAVEARGRRREARLAKIVGEDARKNAESLGPGVTEATASVIGVD